MNPLKAANPVTATRGAVGLAGAAVGLAGSAAREAVHGAGTAAGRAGSLARNTVSVLWTDREDGRLAHQWEPEDAPTGPTIATVEPHAPTEPPVDVVGEALAAETSGAHTPAAAGAGFAHEPHAASRDEEHGEAGLQRVTLDEIAGEASAALEGDVEPEEHVTEPLLDPSDAKAAAAELGTMSRAARTDKS